MYLTDFLEIAIIHLFAVMSPGPDFAVVTRYSINYGRQTGRWVAFGIGTGILLHVAYSILGVSLLIHRYDAVYTSVVFLGACYFIWLGIPALLAKAKTTPFKVAQEVGTSVSRYKAFWIGFLTNGLNIKATLFFIMLFSSVIAPQTPLMVKVGYGLYLAIATGAWFSLLAVIITWQRFYAKFWQYSHWIDRVMGVILLLFSAHLLQIVWQFIR